MPGDPTIPNREELSRMAGGDNRLRQALEDLFYLIPDELGNVTGAIASLILPSLSAINSRVSELEFTRHEIDFNDSPYQAKRNEFLTVDTTLGDVEIDVPGDGIFKVTKEFGDNEINFVGTINGVSDFKMAFAGSTASFRHNGQEWRLS